MEAQLEQTATERVSSRKLLIFLGLNIIGTVALFTGFFQPEHWMEYTKWMFGFYVAGNAFDRGAKALTLRVGKK